MLFAISEIGNDLEFRGAIASPTVRIDGMTVAEIHMKKRNSAKKRYRIFQKYFHGFPKWNALQ